MLPFPRRPLAAACALALVPILSAGLARADDVRAGPLTITQPWARATPKGAKVGGGYLSITNAGREPDTLVGGSLTGAGHAEIHRMSMDGSIMRMGPVEGGLTIAPGETVTLRPGGYHLMFMDLEAPLTKGATVAGTLVFARAGTVPLAFRVEALAAQAPATAGDAHPAHRGN